jgi:hypothetical protein
VTETAFAEEQYLSYATKIVCHCDKNISSVASLKAKQGIIFQSQRQKFCLNGMKKLQEYAKMLITATRSVIFRNMQPNASLSSTQARKYQKS